MNWIRNTETGEWICTTGNHIVARMCFAQDRYVWHAGGKSGSHKRFNEARREAETAARSER